MWGRGSTSLLDRMVQERCVSASKEMVVLDEK